MKIKKLIYCALFAALTGVLSQIAVPLPGTPVPVNLALVSVLIAGGVLGAKEGMVSQLIYVVLGVVGVPVFAKFNAGIGALTGPTGGYIAGYVFAALFTGLLLEKRKKNLLFTILAMIVGVMICYIIGTAYFMFLTGNTLKSALYLCVIPFIPADLLKIAVSAMAVNKLKGIKF